MTPPSRTDTIATPGASPSPMFTPRAAPAGRGEDA
jgi:hypothetical protein